MAYEQREFIIYSTTKTAFQELLDSGGVSESQIGIISDTSEFWAKGNYYPLVDLEGYMKKGDPIDLAVDLSGHVETSEERFRFRASGGDKSIRDESALIRKIKGRAIINNQWIYNGDFSKGRSYWTATNSTLSVTSGVGVLQNTTGSNQYISQRLSDISPGFSVGDKIFAAIDFKRSSTASSQCTLQLLAGGSSAGQIQTALSSNARRIVSGAFTITRGGCDEFRVYPFRTGASGTATSIYNIQLVNLTKMFGVGHEPSASEFSSMFNNNFLPYSTPYLQGLNIYGLKTVGFNCFNKGMLGNGYISKVGDISSSTEYKTSDFIRVLPNTTYYALNVCNAANHPSIAMYDSRKVFVGLITLSVRGTPTPVNASGSFTTSASAAYIRVCTHSSYVDSCCVNISHTGVRNGEYDEYKSFTREIPEIRNIFPKGMMSIGDVYDEINETCAIKRIGLRNFEDGDFENDAFISDGTFTIYELDSPIVEEFGSPIQLDYDVFDWGTEEVLIGDNTADLLIADISYQFNAEGRIRDNSRNIERLEKLINASAASTPYVFKSFSAIDFSNAEGGDLQMDFDPDDLQGGEISMALLAGRPIYITAGIEDGFRGITPMRWIYEEDMIYGSFINPIDGKEYQFEIGNSYVSLSKRDASPQQSDWTQGDVDDISYIKNKPDTTIPVKRVSVTSLNNVDELIPGYLYEQTSALATTTVPVLTDDYDEVANFWIVRIPMTRNGSVINFSETVLWANGAPTYSFSGSIGGYGIFEITLKRDLTGHILGEWKFFKQ
jgi:hypothetical protein